MALFWNKNWDNKTKKLDGTPQEDCPNLRAEIARAGFKSLHVFADAIGMKYTTLWSKLSGHRPWQLHEARIMSLYFNCDMEYLFYGKDKK